MYIYAQLNDENVCVGYKSLSSKIDSSDGYVYIGENFNANKILYSKYDFETKVFSEKKYYPEIEEIPNDIDALKNKIDILNAQSANLLLDNAKKEIEISTLNTNLANITLEVAKIKGGM